jgi:hypothetical protein
MQFNKRTVKIAGIAVGAVVVILLAHFQCSLTERGQCNARTDIPGEISCSHRQSGTVGQ